MGSHPEPCPVVRAPLARPIHDMEVLRVFEDSRAVRRPLLAAMLSALLVIVAACGADDGNGVDPATPDNGATPEAPANGEQPTPGDAAGEPGGEGLQPPENNVDLVVWNPFTGPDGNFFNQIVDNFNAEHDTITVTVQTQPGAEYIQRLEAAASANQLPHVIAAGYDALPMLVENGVVVPIDDFVDRAGMGAGDFPEAIWNASRWRDQQVGVPIDTHPIVFFYNKSLFEQAGLDPENPPTDRDSFEQAIQAINDQTDADGYQMVASGPGASFLVGIQFASLFYQGGGEWTNADYTEATFNSEAGVQAAEWLASLVNDFNVPRVESDAEINAFQQGRNAMVWSGIWETTRYADALGDDLGVAEIPNIFGDGAWGGSHSFAVTSAAQDGDEQQAAYYFINWFSENSLDWGAAGQIPARNDVRDQMADSQEGLLPLINELAPMAENVQFLPTIPGGGDLLFVENGAGEAAVLVVNGGVDAQQALDNAAEYNTQILQENKDRYGF
jgi:multiple sugar transport system substrate-binding protein